MGFNSTPGFSPEKLRAARLRRGLSQRALGEQINRPRQVIVRWETLSPVSSPRPPMLRAIANVLGVSVEDLLEDDRRTGLAGLRLHRGLTQAQLAEATQIPRSTIQALESGLIHQLRDEYVRSLAAGLKTTQRAVRQAHAEQLAG